MSVINDTIIEYEGHFPENTYHKFCKNYYSQNGEDGIIEKLFEELDISSGYCCEFGANDGISSSNTYHLIKTRGFHSLQIEYNPEHFYYLVQLHKDNDKVKCLNEMVTSTNLREFLSKFEYPKDFDLLSIDVDSCDYEIWKGLEHYEPKIVIIETNSYRDPLTEELNEVRTSDHTIESDPLFRWQPMRAGQGASFIKVIELGLEKGYVPVAYTGNITFVHKNYIDKLKEFPYKLSASKYDYLHLYTNLCMWKDKWCTNTGLMFNVALKNYFLKFHNKNFDLDWVLENMSEYGHNLWDYKPENSIKYVVSSSRNDGFGAQFQQMLAVILYSENNNMRYAHKSIVQAEHNYDDNESYIENIENLMNLRGNYEDYNKVPKEDVTGIGAPEIYHYFDANIDQYLESQSMENIRKVFWANKDRNVFKNTFLNVAVHVRRPNSHDSRLEGADTPDSYYLNAINHIRSNYSNIRFHIYSQGNEKDFEVFKADDTELHLDTDLTDTFTQMVGADILVMSRSSLSYAAAILSKGIVYYLPFWHMKASKWQQLPQ